MTSGIGALLALALALSACSGRIERSDGAPSDADGSPDGGARSRASGAAGDDLGRSGAGGERGGVQGDDPDAPFVAAASVARRLSRAELDNALRDLLGDTRGMASQLLPEDPYSPYDNDYSAQLASSALIDSLSTLAGDVAAYVVGDAELLQALLPCQPSGPGDRVCFRQLVAELTQRAFRRPLADPEIERYLGLLDFATEDNPEVEHGFDTAVELLIRAVLIDPEFLYRIEVGEPTAEPRVARLTDYEIATRMSFLLWGTQPDDALRADARAGRLRDADSRRTVARRMLDDPRAREQLHRFFAMWLGYRVIPHDPQLAAAFGRETGALIDRVVFDDRDSYLELFRKDETFIGDDLAAHYGLPLPGAERWVAYGGSGRAGILSHGSFLSAFGKFSDTSPTQRGILIRTRLLCQTLPPPPPNVMADKPPGEGEALCKWDRYQAHRTSPACAGCHGQMDPIGFGLERYDLAGRYREHDDGKPECAIEGRGELPPYGSFSGPKELGELLIESGELERCVVSQYLQFAFGRALSAHEQQEVDRLTAAMRDHDTQLLSLLEALSASEAFALRKEPLP